MSVANGLFYYRNEAARLVGKLTTPDGTLPFLLPIHRTDEGNCLSIPADYGRSERVFGLPALIFMVYAPLCLPRWLRWFA